VIGAFDDVVGAGAMHEARAGGQRGVAHSGQYALYTVRARSAAGRGGRLLVAPPAGEFARGLVGAGGAAAPVMAGALAVQTLGGAGASAARGAVDGASGPGTPHPPTSTQS
jgi:hypothetical protein